MKNEEVKTSTDNSKIMADHFCSHQKSKQKLSR